MFGAEFFERAAVGLPILILALTIHEYFHAWTALKFGDPTARDMGRLTFFPPAHLDFMGSMVMIISQFQFGWAKPVPVNPYNLRNPKVADFWISFAGPLSNIGQAIIFAILFRVIINTGTDINPYFIKLFAAGVNINLILAFFNMIPLFPLDGSHMLRNVLSEDNQRWMDQLDRFAPLILIALIITGVHWIILGPFVTVFRNILLG
jgi:Zn-dependent protease